MKPRILIITAVIVILALLISLCLFVYFRVSVPISKLKQEASRYEFYRNNFANLHLFMTDEEKRKLRIMVNDYHVEVAQKLGVPGLVDNETIYQAVKKGYLVSLNNSRFWGIKDLEDSFPFVLEDTLKLLQLIGKRFHEYLKHEDLPVYRYTISSVLRPAQAQKRLVRKNRNATRNVSSHQFGTTVDILFTDFEYTAEDQATYLYLVKNSNNSKFKKTDFDQLGSRYSAYLKIILAKTLLQLQNEGKCLVIYETRQPVFHVTLAQKF